MSNDWSSDRSSASIKSAVDRTGTTSGLEFTFLNITPQFAEEPQEDHNQGKKFTIMKTIFNSRSNLRGQMTCSPGHFDLCFLLD